VLEGDAIHVVLPSDWPSARVNGAVRERGPDGRIVAAVPSHYRAVVDLAVSRDGETWTPWRPNLIDGGAFQLRFKMPSLAGAVAPDDAILLLRGVGARSAKVTTGGQTITVDTHSYRDNIVGGLSSRLRAKPGDEVRVAIERSEVEYVSAKASPSGERIAVSLDAPLVFAPSAVRIER
jgi:hypothetical protein